MTTKSFTRTELRETIRRRRRGLLPTTRAHAAQRVLGQLKSHPSFTQAKTIALYLAQQGELDPAPIARLAQQLDKQVLLPVLRPAQRLGFMPYQANLTRLSENQYGIAEPVWRAARAVPPGAIDLVLMPLVAWDNKGNRLGMGGGYYDRTFSSQRNKPRLQQPVLLGLAYDFQRVSALQAEKWDVPMAGVVTPKGVVMAAREMGAHP